MEITLTNRELLSFFEASKQAAGMKAGLKFAYALAKNLGRIEKDCEALTDQINKRRQSIIDDLCSRDEADKPVIVNNEFQFTHENRRVFEEKIRELQREADELLSASVTVDLHLLKLEHFPAEIEPWVVKGLLPVTEE